MHALSQDQLVDAELTKRIALDHDTVMIKKSESASGLFSDNGPAYF